MRPLQSALIVAASLLGAWGCGRSKPAAPSITVSPSAIALPKGTTQQFTATRHNADASTEDVTAAAAWTSSGATIACVGSAGLVTAVAVGTGVTISADLGGLKGTAAITVDPPAVTDVVVSPTASYLAPGSVLPLQATASYTDATKVDVSGQASWSSGTPAAVVVSGAGVASPVAGAAGQSASLITATFGGRSGGATITVGKGPAIGPTVGNDPLSPQQWHLVNTGQSAYADTGGVPGEDLGLAATYRLGYTGLGVKVGVVDTGLELAHEDLAANVVPGSWNFVNGSADPTSSASTGDHGTSVSGLVAMVHGNGKGGMGVAPSASLNGYNLIVSSQQTSYFVASLGGSAGSPRSDDVGVFNQSWGTDNTGDFPMNPTIEAQYLDGVTRLRGGRGALYVKSAGNGFDYLGAASCAGAIALKTSCQNASMDPINTLPYNVVVGALNASGVRSSYSTAGSAIWVSAPGGEYGLNAAVFGSGYIPEAYMPAMVTTDQSGCASGYAQAGTATSGFDRGGAGSPNPTCSYTNTFNGTSSAAPSTAGSIALLLEANPALGWRDVKQILAATARRVDASRSAVTVNLPYSPGVPYTAELPWITNAAGYRFHNWYGFGAVDVDAAVAMATGGYTNLPALSDTGWLTSGTISLAIPNASAVGATSAIAVPAAPKSLSIEAVQVSVRATHPYPGDLGIELTSPAGTKSILLNIRNGFNVANLAGMVLASNAFYGEASAGTWTIKVVDGDSSHGTGTLTNWQLRIYGH